MRIVGGEQTLSFAEARWIESRRTAMYQFVVAEPIHGLGQRVVVLYLAARRRFDAASLSRSLSLIDARCNPGPSDGSV